MAQEKPPAQISKEREFLHNIRLCEHNQRRGCRPPNDLFPCNFAHWLKDLNVPEEYLGVWSKVWQQGDVDMCFWPKYTPNKESQDRFARQFLWEKKFHPHGIPNWAWGHAVKLGLLTEENVPPNIPKDYDWPKLQKAWHEGKNAGNTNAKLAVVSQAASSSFLPKAPDPQATCLLQWKPKDKDDVHKEESPEGNQKTRQNMDPKETPQDQEPKCKDDGHKESAEGNQETRQDMDPKETPQDQEPKHKDDGHKEESAEGNQDTGQDMDPKDKDDGHKEKEPKDKDDSDKEEDHKPQKALLWLETGEDPQLKRARNWLFEGKKQKHRSNKISELPV